MTEIICMKCFRKATGAVYPHHPPPGYSFSLCRRGDCDGWMYSVPVGVVVIRKEFDDEKATDSL
jgi:hypothetical protein